MLTDKHLKSCVYPEWEFTVDSHITKLANDLNVGVPTFENLVVE